MLDTLGSLRVQKLLVGRRRRNNIETLECAPELG